MLQPRPERKRRPLPPVWVHRTPRGTWQGALDGASAAADGARGPRAAPSWRRSFEVLRVLTRADFRARYRAQALGVVWSLLHPVVMMGVISLAFTQVFKTTIPDFPIFLLIGLVLWQWLTNAVSSGTQTFVANADLIKRTVFARRALPIGAVLSYGINFAIESAIVLLFIPVFPSAFRFSLALLLIPVYLLLFFLLLIGVVLATSVLNVIYRDVAYLVNTGLTLLFWLTPVMYSPDKIPMPYGQLILWNPAGAIMQAVRRAVMQGAPPTALGWAQMLAPTAVVLLGGWLLFRRHERMALDYV